VGLGLWNSVAATVIRLRQPGPRPTGRSPRPSSLRGERQPPLPFFTLRVCEGFAERRTIQIHRQEDLLIQLRRRSSSRPGRAELRKRVAVEHRLARVGAIQGDRARYRGARKNELDLNRAAAIANLHVLAALRATG
jgi:hypothetical protein